MPDSRISTLNILPTLNFGRCMTSEVVELVTNDDQHFFVHKAILTSQSTSFQNTPERTVDLSEWNSDTVARLVEFLYCRNYDYPDPTPLEPRAERSLGENLPPAQADSEVENPRRPLTPLPDCLGSSLALDMAPRTDVERLHPFDPPHYDFGGILLAHAKVYSLASSKSIIPLQTLALRRLLLVLLRLHPLQPQSHILKNIVDFTRYVYASNLSVNTDFLVSSEEPLRKLASQLIALNFAVFHSQPDAVELIAQGGDLVTDVMAKVCRRLSDPVGVTWTAGPTEEVMGPREELMGPREEVRGPREEVRYISGIKAVRDRTPPSNRVMEASGTGSNATSRWFGTDPVWLVLEYTTIAAGACTKFVVSSCFADNISPNGPLDYVVAVKDKTVPAKITEVLLYQNTSHIKKTCSALGYDGMTGDIWQSMASDPLHLVWKTTRSD